METEQRIREPRLNLLLDDSQPRKTEYITVTGKYIAIVGYHSPDSAEITINLDVLGDYYFKDERHWNWTAKQCDLFIRKLTTTISHEYIHHLLNEIDCEDTCMQFDQIAKGERL
jgi:hypothetical protein